MAKNKFVFINLIIENKTDSIVFIGRKSPGLYAVSVSGRLPAGIIRELKSRGINYRSRDRSSAV